MNVTSRRRLLSAAAKTTTLPCADLLHMGSSFIDNEWVQTTNTDGTLDVTNPATNAVIGTIAWHSGAADAAAAIDSASTAFATFNQTHPAQKRAAILTRWAEVGNALCVRVFAHV
jgi:delta 1-pyrroline-5-carboxylate dehydrogenase